ncbi:hypothetical protein PILCRDRAFT_87816 [Piloderma croceum F 1598]|uniref:Uncharacterized protein n=1 Tax=Piloderma croceum (strain F 1598) TaxID=765440 RepID=A0A0C3BC05_PILCF|nr:hypothetical protein PILCRDRAFT_87816 [Piloderma croceum F 1598]
MFANDKTSALMDSGKEVWELVGFGRDGCPEKKYEGVGAPMNVDLAHANIAGTFDNAFINAGFGNDRLMVKAEEGNSWIYKNKVHGMMSVATSLGLSLLWDTDVGLSHINKYTYLPKNTSRAEHYLPLVFSTQLAYVGSHHEDLPLLLQHIADDSVSMEIASLFALAEGFMFVGLQDGSEAMTETLEAISRPITKQAQVLIEACPFAGTGNVLRVQAMLHHCDEHIRNDKEKGKEENKDDKDKEKRDEPEIDDTFHAFTMQCGDPIIHKMVLLVLDLVSAPNPVLHVLDTLFKYSRDNDHAVALNAIFTWASITKSLIVSLWSTSHMVPMGKGTIGLNPFFLDWNIMSQPAAAGLLVTLTVFTDAKAFMLHKYHWMLYFLVTTICPHFLTKSSLVYPSPSMLVRSPTNYISLAINVVSEAGKPWAISGFQTLQTPV